jgi:uncharacterized membrane protein YraQ (UPF0718 family)
MVDIFSPIQKFADVLTTLFFTNSESKIAHMFNFFIYDSIKIVLLLFFLMSIIGYLRTYIPPNKVKKWLTGRKLGTGNLFASFLGAITPFCSCSSIPIFISFLKAGVPLGLTFSFLITSPIVNQYVVVIMLGLFGWKITLAYVLAGIILGTVGGILLGKMNLEHHLEDDIMKSRATLTKDPIYKTQKKRIIFGFKDSLDMIKKIWIWIFIGVGIGALFHGFVPEQTVQDIMQKGGALMVPIATVIGVPIYASCAAIIPLVLVLFEKGVNIGTALAFMMSVSALSLPEAIILRRVMKLKLIGIFFLVVTLSIIIVGYLLNLLQPILI